LQRTNSLDFYCAAHIRNAYELGAPVQGPGAALFASAHDEDPKMAGTFDGVTLLGKEQFEAASAAAAAVTKGWQSIAAETTDYSKKSFEKSRILAEKLIGVKKIDEAIQLQSEFAKSAYEDFVAEATKITELYSNIAKEVFKPVEAAASKVYSSAE
jgi:hypothetical protein